MTCETILHEEEGAIGWLTFNRPDDGKMCTLRRCHGGHDGIDEVRRETRTRGLFGGCVLPQVGELPGVSAFQGEACGSDHPVLGDAHGELRL